MTMTKEQRKRYYLKHKDEILRKCKEYKEKNKDRLKEYNKDYYLENKEERNEYDNKYRINNKPRIAQREKTKYHTIEEYRLKMKVRANTRSKTSFEGKICEICSGNNKLNRHHPDYTKPELFVILCRKCHEELHRLLLSTGKEEGQ